MSNRRGPAWANFLRLFRETARHRHRYEVFRDFVTMAAFSLHNRVHPIEALEAEYLAIIGRYERDDVDRFPKLLSELVAVLDVEPWDALGQLYMELGIQSEHVGQFFTPPEISELMARLLQGRDFEAKLAQPFVEVSEPACGAGGMILAFSKLVIEAGHNPAEKMWAHCQDIDRTAALMCYVQLALWNIPGVVVVGNTLMLESREVFYTPAHYLYRWEHRLATRRMVEAMRKVLVIDPGQDASPPQTETTAPPPDAAALAAVQVDEVVTTIEPTAKPISGATGTPVQFDFGF